MKLSFINIEFENIHSPLSTCERGLKSDACPHSGKLWTPHSLKTFAKHH